MGITIGKAFDAASILSALNVEMGSLGRDIASNSNVSAMLQNLQKSLESIGSTTATMPPAALTGQQLSQVVTKIVFVSVLNEAINKASKNAHFNVETAINDLWVHLDAARKFSGGGSAARAAGSPSTDVEMQKLKRMMQKRAELFSVLGAIMTKYDQSAKNVIQSMRG